MPMMQDGGMTSEKPELSQPQKDGNEGNQPIDEKKQAQVMKMLDGLKEMPPEDQLVGMIAKAVRVSEDEARKAKFQKPALQTQWREDLAQLYQQLEGLED